MSAQLTTDCINNINHSTQKNSMQATFKYNCGALIADIQLGGLPYRAERRLIDEDTEVGLYVIKRVDNNNELLRNGKLIDNPECFKLYTASREKLCSYREGKRLARLLDL